MCFFSDLLDIIPWFFFPNEELEHRDKISSKRLQSEFLFFKLNFNNIFPFFNLKNVFKIYFFS